MKRLSIFGLFLVCQLSLGFNSITNCANTPFALTYSTGSTSLPAALKGIFLRSKPTLYVSNPSACRVCVNTLTQSATVAPTAGDGHEHCAAPGDVLFFDQIDVGRGPSNVYIRNDVASCATGIIDVDIY